MKVYNKILENLRNGIKLQSLNDDIIEKVADGCTVRLYQCNDCGGVFDEDSIVSVRTDMENYYGVGSDFPDHHYENLLGCPDCNSTDIEELGLYELEDFADGNLYEASQWKRLSGPKYKNMDEKYEKNIINKLIPMLHNYGLDMALYPTKSAPGYQNYAGYAEDGSRVDFKFISEYEPTRNNRNGKYDMTVKIHHKGNEEIAGVINLNNRDSVDEAFELITMTLENMGIIGNKQEEKPAEDNSELDDLANFKKSLSEQELLEVEVDD